MKLNKNSWHARFYKKSYVTNVLPKNICNYFWSMFFAIILLPVTWWSYVIKSIETMGQRFVTGFGIPAFIFLPVLVLAVPFSILRYLFNLDDKANPLKTLTLVVLLFTSNSFAQVVQTDKVAHFGAGYVAGAITAGVALPIGNGKNEILKMFPVSIGVGLALGTGKELYDKSRGGKFDYKDIGATALGAVIGSMSVTIPIKWYKKRHLQQTLNNSQTN